MQPTMRLPRIRSLGVSWAVACGLFYPCAPAVAQVSSLSLSSGTGSPGTTTGLALSFGGGGTAPAALQWTFSYPPSQISAVSATAGPAATAAGKTLSCSSAQGSLTCLLAGLNTSAIAAGIVANVQVTLTANATTTLIGISNPVGVAATGSVLPALTTTGGIVAVPALSSITCAPGSLNGGQISTCTVTLTQTAPTGGSSVILASNDPLLTVPASVSVAAGATTATFSATAAASIASNQSATVTATLGSSSQTASISLLAPVLVSGVACSPTSLGQNAVSTCAVTLTQAAPTGGSSVTLASNNASLAVPASVSVAPGATTATFSATAAASIKSTQSATVTAYLGSSSQTVTISLVAPGLVSSVACNPAILGPGGLSNCVVSLTQALPAISLVHVTSCGPQTFPSTCTIPATGSGNLIVVAWGSGPYVNPTVSSITDNAGNVYAEAGDARAADPVAGSIDIWYVANSKSGATSVTVTPSASGTDAVVIWEFSNVALTSPLDQTSVLNSQLPTITPAGASVTTTVPNEVVISVLTPSGATIGLQLGSAFTIDSFLYGNGWSHLITSPTGSYAPQWDIALGSYASSTVSFKAASGSVTLTSNDPLLTVPASVSVAAGATTATFSATAAASIASNQSATVTATLGSSSQTATISLLAPVLVSTLACSPTSLGQSAVSTCTITLTQTAPTGGASVTLTSNNASLTVPASVTVAAGATTATFSATAAASISSNQSATITATLGSSSQTATISSLAPLLVSGVACIPTTRAERYQYLHGRRWPRRLPRAVPA